MEIVDDEHKIIITGEISKETLLSLPDTLSKKRDIEILDISEITPEYSSVSNGIRGITDIKEKDKQKATLQKQVYLNFCCGLKNMS